MPVEHLIPVFYDGSMRMPPVGSLTVIEREPDGVRLRVDHVGPGDGHVVVMLDARQARQLAEQILFVLDGSVIVATNRLEGY